MRILARPTLLEGEGREGVVIPFSFETFNSGILDFHLPSKKSAPLADNLELL